MKIVLKQDVKSIGKKDGVYEVSDGYARNFLFPRGLAVQASASAVNEVKTKAAAKQHHAAEELAAAPALAKKIEGKTVALKAKAGQGGRLFGSVTTKEVAEGLKAQFGLDIDKRKISMADIKAFGSYEAEIKLHAGIAVKITVMVSE